MIFENYTDRVSYAKPLVRAFQRCVVLRGAIYSLDLEFWSKKETFFLHLKIRNAPRTLKGYQILITGGSTGT